MKKSILFVIPSLSAGGGEKSLLNLLYQINYDLFDIDLLVFSKKGIFFDSVPKQVNILDLPLDYKIFTEKIGASVLKYIKVRKFKLVHARLMYAIKNRLIKNIAISEQQTWKYQRISFGNLKKEYHVAIGFLEKSSIYFTVDKVRAKKKIGWIHTNYTNSGMDSQFDLPYFERLDYLVTVSDECGASLKNTFPNLGEKIKVIHNIFSPKIIKTLANSFEVSIYNKSDINIITVARLSKEKGIDLAIRACDLLKKKGLNIRWFVIGDGNEREKLNGLIEKYNLVNNFKLLGVKENPYPYIKQADIYVQPSRYEGKSIAIDEAKSLLKPIVVTNYTTAKDQISNGENGLIVDKDENGISVGIEKLIRSRNITEKLISNLLNEKLGTEEEIKKLYEMISG